MNKIFPIFHWYLATSSSMELRFWGWIRSTLQGGGFKSFKGLKGGEGGGEGGRGGGRGGEGARGASQQKRFARALSV